MFSVDERTDWSSLQYNESQYEFLDRNSWPIVGLAREWINGWIVPFQDDPEFIARFKSKKAKQHAAAIMELLLFYMLKGGNLDIERLARSAGKTPDFAVRCAETAPIYLECSLAANAMEDDEDKAKTDALMRWFEAIDDFPFFVGVHVKTISGSSISKRQLYQFLDQYRGSFSHSPGMFTVPYTAQGWDLEMTLMSKTDPSVRRTKGFQHSSAKTVDNFKALFTALNDKKPGPYKIGQAPYIICIGVDDMTANQDEFFQVLYGGQYKDCIHLNWHSTGFFLHNCQPQNTSVSAVMFCKNIKLFGLSDLDISLWHNPFASEVIPSGLFPFREIFYKKEGETLIPNTIDSHVSPFALLKKDIGLYKYLRSRDYTAKGKP